MQDPKTARLELEGFPEGVAFRPHGMYYRRETKELFVVNHAYSQGGERIDVFKVRWFHPKLLMLCTFRYGVAVQQLCAQSVCCSGRGWRLLSTVCKLMTLRCCVM